MRTPALVFVGVLALAVAACSGDGDGGVSNGGPTLPAGASATLPPADAATAEPGLPDRSGIPEVDATLDALESGDREALTAQIAYAPFTCSATPEGIGGTPLCPTGVAPGEAVEVFPFVACEPMQLRPETIDLALDTMQRASVYAAYRAAEDARYGAEYSVLLEIQDSEAGQAFGWELLLNAEGRIVGIVFSCALPAPEFAQFLDVRGTLVPPQR